MEGSSRRMRSSENKILSPCHNYPNENQKGIKNNKKLLGDYDIKYLCFQKACIQKLHTGEPDVNFKELKICRAAMTA